MLAQSIKAYTVLYRSNKFRTRALTLRLCFCCFKGNEFHGYKTGSIQFGTAYPELLRLFACIPLPNFVLLTLI